MLTGPVGGHFSTQAGRSISYQATPAGPARPIDGKTHKATPTVGQQVIERLVPAVTSPSVERLLLGVADRMDDSGLSGEAAVAELGLVLGEAGNAQSDLFQDFFPDLGLVELESHTVELLGRVVAYQ